MARIWQLLAPSSRYDRGLVVALKNFPMPEVGPIGSITALGRGGYAKVLRYSLGRGRSEIIKEYESESAALSDVAKLQVLSIAVKDKPGSDPFRVVKVISVNGKTCHLQDTRGVPLDHAIKSYLLDGREKQALMEIYRQRVDALIGALETQGKVEVFPDPQDPNKFRIELTQLSNDGLARSKQFFIKPSNVILNPRTLAMTIIDPM